MYPIQKQNYITCKILCIHENKQETYICTYLIDEYEVYVPGEEDEHGDGAWHGHGECEQDRLVVGQVVGVVEPTQIQYLLPEKAYVGI